MSFDEQPDGDPHGECAAEIHMLRDLLRDEFKQATFICSADWECSHLALPLTNSHNGLLANASAASAIFLACMFILFVGFAYSVLKKPCRLLGNADLLSKLNA